MVFKQAQNFLRREIIEVWLIRDGKEPVFVAGIYPHEKSLTVVSKFMGVVKKDDSPPPPQAIIEFNVP